MASTATASTPLDTVIPRPPTPPREAAHEPDFVVRSLLNRVAPFDPRLSLQTPPNAGSPASSVSNPSSSQMRKKVEWSIHTEYKEPLQYWEGGKLDGCSPASVQSSASSKPVKGILKPSAPNPLASSLAAELNGPHGQIHMAEMLESTTKQLAGSDRVSKLDAYMMLSRALKASNNLPDRVALQDKMGLFMQFIQRDMSSRQENGSPDTSLVNHALHLLTTFLHFPAVASTLTSDFGVFIIDYAIRCFESTNLPKDVVRHMMQAVAFQNFSPKVMTSDRVGRLVAALHTIEDRIKGKSIVMSRIQIYKRLIHQSRSHMSAQLNWLKDMLVDMQSSVKDIRAQAISLGMDAGFALRSEKQVMRKMAEILQTTDGDQTYIDFYLHKLEDMSKDKQHSSSVPQILSVLILFMRCPLERWKNYTHWLKIFQTAFNSSDPLTKQEANYAWNRYVYLSLVDTKMSPKTLSTLCQPLLSQLRRKALAKQPEEGLKFRKVIIGGVCNMYYYAFEPNSEKYSPTTMWDVIVHPVMQELIKIHGKAGIPGDCLMQASRLLVGLLDAFTPRVWRSDRIMEVPPAKADELPAVAPKWVRKNCDKVFQSVGPILENKFLDLANKESWTSRLWQALVSSISAAAAKDIKVSEDTAKFVAHTFGLLSRVWSKGATGYGDVSQDVFLSSVKAFIKILVDGLALLPFTERKLSMTLTNTFESVATPSHHPDRVGRELGIVLTPLHHLCSMLCVLPPGIADDVSLSEFLGVVFEPFLSAGTAKSRLRLSREFYDLQPQARSSPFATWSFVASSLCTWVDERQNPTHKSPEDKLPGPELREVVSHLENGLSSYLDLPLSAWLSLFNHLSDYVTKEFGDAGRAMIVIEPISKILYEQGLSSERQPPNLLTSVVCELLENARLPCDRQAIEADRRRLWGTASTLSRPSHAESFTTLYKVGALVSRAFYHHYNDAVASPQSNRFLTAVASFLSKTPQALLQALSHPDIQHIFLPWIEDEQARLKLGSETPVSSAVSIVSFRVGARSNNHQVRLLWEQTCVGLASHRKLNHAELAAIEPLLATAFKSKHRFIVGKAVDAWNVMFKDEEQVECSDSLKSIISSISSRVDLVLPGTELANDEQFGAQTTVFIDSQSDIVLDATDPNSRQISGPKGLPLSFTQSKSRKRQRDATPEIVQSEPPKKSTTPRHENPRIRFAPIVSSPPPVEESQHLTKRQKEVRERQRENASIYPDIHSNTPDLPNKATPERPASYEELISSTPTPRRGQLLNVEDYNDPPSSPPEPRPYPLLDEIQSRSRTSSSLGDWEFSSPAGTPVTSRQQVTEVDKPSQLVLTNVSAQSPSNRRSEHVARTENSSMNVIPSSIITPLDDDVPQDGTKAKASPKIPSTPPRRAKYLQAKNQASSSYFEDKAVHARASPGASPSYLQGEMVATTVSTKDTSFALSEGDESGMVGLVIELEQRRCDTLTVNRIVESEQSQAQDCITVEEESISPSPPKRQPVQNQVAPVIPSTPLEPSFSSSADETGRNKRKRAGKAASRPRKKKQSLEESGVDTDKVEESQTHPAEEPSLPAAAPANPRLRSGTPGVQTRRSSRRLRQEPKAIELREVPKGDIGALSANLDTARDAGGDTDEELPSQLAEESHAASQSQTRSQSQRRSAQDEHENKAAQIPSTIEDSMASESLKRQRRTRVQPDRQGPNVARPQNDEEEMIVAPASASLIIESLKGSLDVLRSAALGREEVYKLEDMLMDMKRELYEAERRGRTR